MSGVVFKYEVPVPDPVTLRSKVYMPVGAEILSCGIQNRLLGGDPVMVVWARLESDTSIGKAAYWINQERELVVANTGDEFETGRDEKFRFINSIAEENGAVWHVFEVRDEPF